MNTSTSEMKELSENNYRMCANWGSLQDRLQIHEATLCSNEITTLVNSTKDTFQTPNQQS
jgi:hypothetical protein